MRFTGLKIHAPVQSLAVLHLRDELQYMKSKCTIDRIQTNLLHSTDVKSIKVNTKCENKYTRNYVFKSVM